MRIATAVLVLLSTSAAAQDTPTQFPDGASPLSTEALTQALAGKLFAAQPVSGPPWRLQYKDDGYVYVNIGNFSDTGKWHAKDSSVCSEGRKFPRSCNEVRVKDGGLFLKRDSGEVIKLEPR